MNLKEKYCLQQVSKKCTIVSQFFLYTFIIYISEANNID